MGENPDVVAAFLGLCCQVRSPRSPAAPEAGRAHGPSFSQIVRLYPRIFSALPPHYLDAVLSFAERGLAMQEQFSLKTTMELLVRPPALLPSPPSCAKLTSTALCSS